MSSLSSKILVNFFLSYAHSNNNSVKDFIKKFMEHLLLSKKFKFDIFTDSDIILGENWNTRIIEEIKNSDVGLFLLSASFFGSDYISFVELPKFVNQKKLKKEIISIGIEKFNVGGDLRGLEKYQIFLYKGKFYNELSPKQRIEFIIELIKQIELKLLKRDFISN